jgi:flagellar biosynthesis/type III secretory pathway chaperone
MDMGQRVQDLIVITTRLSELLRRENDAIRDNRFGVVSELLEQKATLSRAYETRLKGMVDNAVDLEEVDPDLCERLQVIGKRMQELTEENGRLLKISMKAHESFIGAIAGAVKTSTGAPDTYSPYGTSAATKISGTGNRPPAISFNETL